MRILPSHRTVLILQAPKLEQLGTRSRSSELVSTYKKARKTKVTNTPYLIRPRISARPGTQGLSHSNPHCGRICARKEGLQDAEGFDISVSSCKHLQTMYRAAC